MSVKPYTGIWSPNEFRGKELVGVDFSGRCLVGADFSGAICKDCDFSDSDLSNANFQGSDLYRCTFSRAILYAVIFDDANLTRANFQGAYTYGWLLNSSANVTYANLLHFEIEDRRRSVSFMADPGNTSSTLNFGDRIGPTKDLCRRTYKVEGYRFTFDDLDQQEASLQRSQIFNQMKRLYRENHNGEAAIHCQYYERYHLTRSYYKYSALTGGKYREQIIRTIIRTGAAYATEFLSGYGVRPLRILRNLALLLIIFFLCTLWASTGTPGSGVVYHGTTVATETHGTSTSVRIIDNAIDLGRPDPDIPQLIRYSIVSMVTPDSNQYTPYGTMAALSIAYFISSACLLALLFSSIFLRLLSE